MKTFLGTFKTSLKAYPFNTEEEVEVGDILDSESYTSHIVVTEVLDEAFLYFIYKGGVTNDSSTATSEIKTITFNKVEKE